MNKRQTYVVQFVRTESCAYEIKAANENDARERFLVDGDEVENAGHTLNVTITAVDLGTADEVLG